MFQFGLANFRTQSRAAHPTYYISMNVNHLVRYEELGVAPALAVRLLEETMSARRGPGGGPRHVDVCAMLPSLGSLSINDAPSPPPALPGADSLRPAPGGVGEMLGYSMGTVEDIGAKEDKKRKIAKEQESGQVEWFFLLEGTTPENPVWIFNSNLLNAFLRKENTANNWIFWYPWRVGKPGVFNFAMGELNFSDFVPYNGAGIEWNTKYVDGNGTHHPNPHYLRPEWTTGFTVKYLKPELQEQKYNEDPQWWVTWNKAEEPEGNMVTHVVPASSGCPATKQEMIAPFLKWLEEHHDRTQAQRLKKAELYARNPEHKDFMIKSKDKEVRYKPPIPPLDWPREKFAQLLAPWFAQPEDTPEGAILDEFVVHVKLLDAAPGTGAGVLKPPPGFIAYRRGRATGDNVPKPGEPKPKDRSFKVAESIYIGPRWKQWRKGQDGEKNKPSKPKKGTEQKESKGFLMVRELAPRACWLTYINAQTSGSSGDANKQASAKVDETDEAAQAKKAAAAAVLEQNRSAHSRALARREAAQRAGGMGGSNDPMPDAAATKRKKDDDSGIPSDSDEEDDDDSEDDEAAADDIRQSLVNKPAARDKQQMTLEEMQARRKQLLEDDDDDSDDEEQGDQ